MRRILLCLALLALLATSASAGRIADSLAFQGRMTNDSDVPVTGTQMVILSLWTDSTGGTLLHTEDQQIQFTNGLFHVCVGCAGAGLDDSIFSVSPQLWMQVQVSGQPPMTPRLLFRSSPRAVTSSRVLGDIETSHNRLAIGDLDADGRLDLVSKPDTAGFLMERVTSFKSRSGNMVVLDDRASMSLKTYQPGQPSYGNITFEASDGQVSSFLDCDSDDDGVIDSRLSLSLGHGGGGAGGLLHISTDLDGDGIGDNTIDQDCDGDDSELRLTHELTHIVQQSAGATGARVMATSDLDQNGAIDRAVFFFSEDIRAQFGISEPGVQIAHSSYTDSTVFESSLSLAGKNIIHRDLAARNLLLSSRSLQDDFDTSKVDIQIDSSNGGTARLAIKTKGTSAQRYSSGGDCDDTDATLYTDCDDDGDGVSDASVVQSSSPDSVTLQMTAKTGGGGGLMGPRMSTNLTVARQTQQSSFGQRCDTDNDGLIDVETEMRVTPTTASLAINSKGTSAKRVMASAGPDSASIGTDDDDCDGLMSSHGGTARLAIKTKGTSAKRVSAVAGPDSASIAIDEPGVHIAMRNKGWDGTIKGNLRITDGTDLKVDFDGDGDGYLATRLGIGVLDPANPIEHSSGAHLTAGGVWTNASDENLKENFKPVDGEVLLEKIEELPISQWNYRAESDEVTHIGPTAQDFKEAFGVGASDKTISTIDPSGIALAAIKELGRQNRELKEENKKMKDLLDQLMIKVEQLSSDK